MDLKEVLEGQKKQLEDFRKQFGDQLDDKITKLVNGQLEPVAKDVQTVGDALAAMQKQVDGLEAQIKAQTKIPGLAEEVESEPIMLHKSIPGLPGYEKNGRDAERLREISVQARDMASSDADKGGILVPLEVLPGFLDLAREEVKIWNPSLITEIAGLNGNIVELPKETGSASVYWVGENTAPTKSDLTFGQVKLSPKKLAAQARISNRLYRQTGQLIENVVRRSIARSIGLELDRVLLRGDGEAYEPLGVANMEGIQSVAIGTNGGDFSYMVGADMVHLLELGFISNGDVTFVAHPSVIHRAKKERIAQYSGDTGGAYVILPMSDQAFRDLFGYNFIKTQQLRNTLTKGTGTALGEIIAGRWKDLYLGLWSNLVFKASNETGDSTGSAMLLDQTWLYAFMECDVQAAYEDSFVLCNDAKTTD